ncbi:MAG: oligosaccharide flippase family protein [Nitrosomonadales bacterium]|nr:oligosaccharide flippase family protein [Nitrosomonadales bacterium]
MKTLISAILSKAGGSLFTLALVVYLGQAIGSRASGYFYFTLAVAVMLSQLLRLGMDGVVLRLASRHFHAGDTDALRRLAGDVLVYLLACGTIMILAGKALAQYAAPLLFPGEAPTLLYDAALYSFVPFTLMWTCAAFLKGMGRTSLSVFIEAGSVPLCVLLLMQLHAGASDYRVAVEALVQANGIAAALALALVYRFAGCRIIMPGLVRRGRELLAEALRGVWVAISNTLIVWSPLFLLGIFATPEDVGVYNAAFRVTMVIGAFSAVFRGVATPRLAGLLQRKESPLPFLRQSMAAIVGAGLLVLLAGELTFDRVFAHFGEGFAGAAGLAMLMLVGMLANVLFVIMETQLILADRNDLLRANAIFTALLTLPLTLLLIAYFQAYGAALGFVITNVLSRGNMLYLFNRMYGCRI